MITDLRSDYVYRGPNIMWGATVIVSSNQDFGGYIAYRNAIVKAIENPAILANPTGQFGFDIVGGNPTLGYGFDFAQISEVEILRAFNAAGTALTQTQLTAIHDYKVNPSNANRTTLVGSGITVDDASATALLNAMLGPAGGQLPTPNNQYINDPYETSLTRRLNNDGAAIAISPERAALVSANYQSGNYIVQTDVRPAINADNRTETWWQIRYGMEQQNGGYQSRRVMESNFFQLVPPSAGLEDKKQIIGYLHFQKLDATGADGSATRNDLLSQTETLRTELEEEYTGGVTVDYVFMEVRDASGGKIFDNANVLEARQDDLDKKYLMFGAGGEDSLTGGDAADFLFGGKDNDTFVGSKGNDLLHGGDLELEEGLQDGEDTADYSASTGAINANLDTGLVEDGLGGTDVLISIEKIVGTALDDHFVGGEGEWTIDGGGGRDTVDYSQIEGEVTISSDGSTVTLPSGKVQHLENIENIIGASTDDELNGGDGANVLIGGDGVDVMKGGKGMDVLVAGDGDDILYGGDDDEIDILDGGAGADKFYVSEGDIVLNFNAGDQVYLNGVLLTGGENFSQWMYDDASKYEQIKLSFVNGDGIAYTFVDAAF